MKVKSENLISVDDILDAKFGKIGTPEREGFRKEAYAYCMEQIIHDALGLKIEIVKPIN